MGDVLNSSLDEVYSKWLGKNPYTKPPRSTDNDKYSEVVSHGRQAWKNKFGNLEPAPQRRTKCKGNSVGMSLKDDSYSTTPFFKTIPTIQSPKVRSRPFMGRCCDCVPNSRNQLYSDHFQEAGLSDILKENVDTRDSDKDWITRTFKYFFQPRLNHKYPDVSFSVLNSPRVLEAVHRTIEENTYFDGEDDKAHQKMLEQQKERAAALLKKMRATISNRLVRLTAWFLHKFLAFFLSAIIVHKGQLHMLQRASQKDLPLIFLPTHRSHLDYILITLTLFNYNIKAPHVAAGDNLIIPVFGFLLKGLGGYFIRRKLDKRGKKDHVYRAVLHSYMEELLKKRQYVEFFIEGGRTRSGKPLYPKGGLLSVIVDSFHQGIMPDANIVPVTVSYDKVIDGDFNSEQMGQRKQTETFSRAMMSIWKVFRAKYGTVRVDFGQPFSLKEYMYVAQGFPNSKRLAVSGSSSPVDFGTQLRVVHSDQSIYGTDMVSEEQRAIVEHMAEHVIHNQMSIQPIMCTHLLAFVLLTKHRQLNVEEEAPMVGPLHGTELFENAFHPLAAELGVKLRCLVETFEWLKDEVATRGRDLGFSGTTTDAVEHACELFGRDLVSYQSTERKISTSTENDFEKGGRETEGNSDVMIIPRIELPHIFELTYYANMVNCAFATESVIANVLQSIVIPEQWYNDAKISISHKVLISRASSLCQLLKYEYIFVPPCKNLESVLSDIIEDIFLATEILKRDESTLIQDTREREWAERLSNQLEWDDSDEENDMFDANYTLNKEYEESMEKLRFFASILCPLLESYYVVACHLTLLQENDWPEVKFMNTVHQALKERVTSGMATYAESAAQETLKNALHSFLHMHVTDSYQFDGQKMIGLNHRYKVEDKLNEFIEEMESYRATYV